MTQETSSVIVPHFNPWLEIWYRPRTTIRRIVQSKAKRDIYLIAVFVGYAQFLQQARVQAMGDTIPFMSIIGQGLITGAIGGIVSLALSTFVISLVARRLGGVAETDETMAALSWGQAPVILTLGLWILQIGVYQDDIFKSRIIISEENAFFSFLPVALLGLGILISIGQFILTSLTLAEVHRFSIWRSIGTLIFSIAVVFVPLIACFGLRLIPL